VTQYYQSLVAGYPTSTLPSGCATPPSALGDFDEISRIVARRCPATVMDSLKTIVGFVRPLGGDLLEMGYDAAMIVVSVLAMPATFAPPAQPQMLATLTSMVASYFEALLVIVLKDVFPLLESITSMVLCSSSIGKIVAAVLQGLCEFYNDVISRVIQGVWCYILMPAVVDLLKFVQGLAQLGGQGAASTVAAISNSIGGGNTPSQCAAGFDTQTTCNFGCDRGTNDSDTSFQPQAMATMCWSGDAGGGLLGGQSSLLTCTASDTCSLDPLSYDQTSTLVYCGSCPILEAGSQGIFACDTVLQRCTCGAVPAAPQACDSTADCLQMGAVCGVSDTIGGVSDAFVTPACSACGSLGQEPVCVVNSIGDRGYCACGNVRDALLACSSVGARVHLGSSTLCLIALSAPLSKTLAGLSTLATTYAVPYADLAVTECLVAGGYSDKCANVRMPLTSTAQGAPRHLVVLYGSFHTSSGGGRRLLQHGHPQADRRTEVELALHDALLLSNASAGRETAKRDLRWGALCAYVTRAHNLTGLFNCSTLAAPMGYPLLVGRLLARPGWVWDVLRELPATRALTVVPQTLYTALFAHEGGGGRRLLEQPAAPAAARSTTINLTEILSDSRVTSVITNNPFSKLCELATLTGVYYREGRFDVAPAVCNDTGWLACGSFRLPPSLRGNATLPLWARALDIILYVPTMGNGGLAVVDALTSKMPYNQTVAGDYITGGRLLHDLSACNRTALTLGPPMHRNILAVLLMAVTFIATFTLFCRPGICLQLSI
jgi:hypothetical protein